MLVLMLAAALVVEPPRLELKGVGVGDPAPVMAGLTCPPPQFDYSDCKHLNRLRDLTFAGAQAELWRIEVYRGKVFATTLTYKAADYQVVREALRAKYGAGETLTMPMRNAMGGALSNEVIRWKTPEGVLSSFQYMGNSSIAGVMLESAEAHQIRADLLAAQTAKVKNDL